MCGAVLLSIGCGGGPTSPSDAPGGPGPGGSSTGVQLTDDFGGRRLLPDDNWWNLDISNAPVDPQSSAYIDFIGRTRTSHPDFGPPPYGIPYIGVGAGQPRVPVTFTAYGSESDSGFGGDAGYPIPPEAATQPNYVEGGVPGGGLKSAMPLTSARNAVGLAAAVALFTRKSSVLVPSIKPVFRMSAALRAPKLPS